MQKRFWFWSLVILIGCFIVTTSFSDCNSSKSSNEEISEEEFVDDPDEDLDDEDEETDDLPEEQDTIPQS